MDENEKMETATALLLMIVHKMVKADFDGPEVKVWTDDSKLFHIVGHAIKEEKSDS